MSEASERRGHTPERDDLADLAKALTSKTVGNTPEQARRIVTKSSGRKGK